MGHRSFECPEKENIGHKSTYVAKPEKEKEKTHVAENMSETRECLMMNKIILKPKEEAVEPAQRKDLFRTVYKAQGKVFQNGD